MPRVRPKKLPYNNPNVGRGPGLSKAERQEILEHFAKGDCPARHFRQFINAIDDLDRDNRRLRQENIALALKTVAQDVLKDAVELALSALNRYRPDRDFSTGEPSIRDERQLDAEVAFLRLSFAHSRAWPEVPPQRSLFGDEPRPHALGIQVTVE